MNSFNNTSSYDNKDIIPAIVNDQSQESCIVQGKFLEKENLPLEKLFPDNSALDKNSKASSPRQEKKSNLVLSNDLKLWNHVSKPNISKQSFSNISSIHQLGSSFEDTKTQNDSKATKNLISQENLKKNPVTISDNALRLSRWHFERGNQRVSLKMYSKAKRHYEKALKRHPSFFEALYNYAMVCYSTHHRAKAFKYLTKANEINLTSKGYKLLGQSCDPKDLSTQIKLFFKALELDQTDSEVKLLIGNTYKKLGDFNQAQKYYFQVIEMYENQEDKQNKEDSLQLSNQSEIIGEPFNEEFSAINYESQEASLEGFFGKGFEKAKTEFKAYFNGAQLLAYLESFDKAMEIYKEAETKFPECKVAVYYKMAELYILEEKFPDAVKMFAKVFVPLKKNVADLTEEQRTILKNIDERFAESLKRHARRGHFLLKIGKLDEALTEFQASYDLTPNDYLSNWHLAKIYIYLGRTEDAETMLKKAHSINREATKYIKVIGVAFDSSLITI